MMIRKPLPYIAVLLITVIVTIYWQVGSHEFISLDDGVYVTENPYIQSGINLRSIQWAIFSTDSPYWHPLAFFSHMLDVHLFGMNAGQHHLVNVLFHILNSILVLVVFNKMTSNFWCSSVVACLFAVHPLNVESVAWIAERKDVLSTFFMFLTLYAYASYTQSRTCWRYFLVFLFFLLSIASKPMMITLPCILLLLDYWPLSRITLESTPGSFRKNIHNLWENKILLEKIPFFITSLLTSGLLISSLKKDTMTSLGVFPIGERICNSVLSYGTYLFKMFLPNNLAVFYPHYESLPVLGVIFSFVFLIFLSIFAIKFAIKAPFFLVGWLWFLGTLLPVIGLLHGGMQSRADRFTYMPLIGIFIIISFGSSYLLDKFQVKYTSLILGLAALCVFSYLIPLSYRQVTYWQNSISLYEHTLEATKDQYKNLHMINVLLGYEHVIQGRYESGIHYYREALRIKPKFAQAHYYLGFALAKMNRLKEASLHYSKSLELLPRYTPPYTKLSGILINNGQYVEAINLLNKLLKIAPSHSPAYYTLGVVYSRLGQNDLAAKYYKNALKINPDYIQAQKNLDLVQKK